MDCLGGGRLAQARQLCRQLCLESPQDAEAWFLMAGIHAQAGEIGEVVDCCRQVIALQPGNIAAHYNLGVALQTQGDCGNAAQHYRTVLQAAPDNLPALYNLGLCLMDATQTDAAIETLSKAAKLAPDSPDIVINLAAAYLKAGQIDTAIGLLRDSQPRHGGNAQLHYVLGNAYRLAGRLQPAIDSYQAALRINPALHEARNNLASSLQETGSAREAAAEYRAALQAKPDEPRIHYNLSTVLMELGQPAQALAHIRTAVRLQPGETVFLQQFTRQVGVIPADLLDAGVADDILRCFSAAGIDHQYLAAPALASLRKDKRYLRLENLAKAGNFKGIADGLRTREFAAVCANSLLRALLIRTVVCDDTAEITLTLLRKAQLMLFTNMSRGPAANEIDFMAALACQCDNNEYAYLVAPDEATQVEALSLSVNRALDEPVRDAQGLQASIAALAMYRPLSELPDWRKLIEFDDAGLLTGVRTIVGRQLRDWQSEREIGARIPDLTGIREGVSSRVRAQYEESPYPRWLGVNLLQPRPYAAVLRGMFPHFEPPRFDAGAIDVLIAGCGTGKHAILSKMRFADSRHLAVDLSRASLAYAQRKASELGLDGLRFMQADILELGSLQERFHIIESVGVLHHMADPGEGLKVLTGLLHPGGLMNIGLYSALARRGVAAARKRYARHIDDFDRSSVRALRREIIDMPADEPIRKVLQTNDFYSLSECRDLLFHVQEHCFTLPQVDALLRQYGLRFIGFEHPDPALRHRFRTMYPPDTHMTDLNCWDRFEQTHPDTFSGMYVFWCQRL
jgi:tetratricopeptide (TPR) repeat protein/2-polyprenyl-3-methyl-5-hydroxy-6-metoxy-1,4-benzoquinol methylase